LLVFTEDETENALAALKRELAQEEIARVRAGLSSKPDETTPIQFIKWALAIEGKKSAISNS
jgi:hypothetical protein